MVLLKVVFCRKYNNSNSYSLTLNAVEGIILGSGTLVTPFVTRNNLGARLHFIRCKSNSPLTSFRTTQRYIGGAGSATNLGPIKLSHFKQTSAADASIKIYDWH